MGSLVKAYNMLHWNYLQEFWREQSIWSQEVFGPDAIRGPDGPIKHLALEILTELLGIDRKSVDEILKKARPVGGGMSDEEVLKEFVDGQFLLVDGCRRYGFTCEQLTKGLFDKLEENKAREWPKFDPTKVNEAVEHIRIGTESNMEVKSTTPEGGITIGPIGDDDPAKQITSNPVSLGCRVVSPITEDRQDDDDNRVHDAG